MRHVHRFKTYSMEREMCQNISRDHLFGIKTAPAWPPLPSKSTFKLAGAAIAVTIPIDRPE